MHVRRLKNVRRALQTDATLFRYASVIRERKKCSELLVQKFDRFQTLGNSYQQHATVCKQTQKVTSNNVGELLANNVASVCTVL